MRTKHILILSPHLDDSVLSCASHIYKWQKQQQLVTVCTLFTSFTSTTISADARINLKQSGFANPRDFETARRQEDEQAMKLLGVKHLYADFVDAGFRTYGKKNIYPTFAELFSGQISNLDTKTVEQLCQHLVRFKQFERILIPLGIGSHADHLITRMCAERVFLPSQLFYYADFPYALRLRAWAKSFLFLTRLYSIGRMNRQKQQLLQVYRSQYPLLFSKSPVFIELVFH